MNEPYRCILADPPWNEQGGGKCKRGADRHYPLMKTYDIIGLLECITDITCRLRTDPHDNSKFLPKFPIAHDAHLWTWCTNNHLPDALEVIRALGFRYITNVAWAKMQPSAMGMSYTQQNPGLGQYLAGQHELLLFAVRGRLPALWKDKESGAKRQGTLICAPRGKHSEKPQAAYDVIENVSPGPRLELFARGAAREGWDVWGNEARER